MLSVSTLLNSRKHEKLIQETLVFVAKEREKTDTYNGFTKRYDRMNLKEDTT